MSILRGAISALKLTGFKAEADSVSQLFSTANQLREELDTLRARIAELERELSHYRTLNIATAREMRRRIEERRVKT